MEFINPLFNQDKITKSKIPEPNLKPKSVPNLETKPNLTPKKVRATRSDKTHNIKFPVSPVIQIKLKSYFRQAKREYQLQGKDELTQTKFNTLLLKYGLSHPQILHWEHEYQDTKVYMHTNLLEREYEREIGGAHGLSIQKNLSDRKVVYHIVLSVLKWLDRGGIIEEIL